MDEAVDMQTHFDVSAELESVMAERFAMPAPVIAAFRQAAMKSAQKLLNLVSADDFDKLPAKDQLKIFEMIFDRAYGKSETASSSMVAMHRTGQLEGSGDHGRQLEDITNRQIRSRGGVTKRGMQALPELAKVEGRAKRAPRPVEQNFDALGTDGEILDDPEDKTFSNRSDRVVSISKVRKVS